MHMLAEVIASALAGGLDWSAALGGKKVYCLSPGLKGADAMSALEQFLDDNSDMAERRYGDALAASVSRALPCQGLMSPRNPVPATGRPLRA